MSILLDHGSQVKLKELRESYFRVAERVFVHCYDSGYPGTEKNRLIDLNCMPDHLRDRVLTVKVDLEDCVSFRSLWKIRGLPTVLLFNNHEEIIWRHEGATSESTMILALSRFW